MTPENKKILDRINAYAETALADIDPQKTRISFQLEALKPVMEEIAAEKGVSVEDIFILYMDLASEASVEAELIRDNPLQPEQGRGAKCKFHIILPGARSYVLRGRRSYADSGPTRTAVLRGQRSYADGGPARTAPEGLVPLDSLSPLRRGIGAVVTVSAYFFSPPKGRRAEEATTNLFFYAQYRIFLRKTIPGIRSSKGDVLTI